MNILLVYPSQLDSNQQPIKYPRAFFPPLAMGILAGLTPTSHNVRIVNDVVEEIDFAGKYDLVGITAMTPQVTRAYQIAENFRKRGVKVVMGGAHPTLLSEEAKPHADAIIIGEAENLWEDVLHDCQAGKLKEFYQDPTHPDLKKLVIPKWDNANMRIYPRRPGSHLPLMPIFTTRGCPLGCRFCAVTKINGKAYRTKPVANVLAEIEKTNATDYFFVDDNIGCNPNYSRELFKSLDGKGISWMSQISTTVLKNPDLIDLAGKAGCFYLFVGFESLNKSSLAGVHKSFNKAEQYEELISRMRQAGIAPFASFIFGFDEDTPEQFNLTVEFIKKNKIGLVALWVLTPVPGSELYLDMKTRGKLISSDWSLYDGTHVVFKPLYMTAEELEKNYWDIYRRLYSPEHLNACGVENTSRSRNPMHEVFRYWTLQNAFKEKVFARQHPFSGGFF